MERAIFIRRLSVGSIASRRFWLLFFASGLLVETVGYRQRLAPRSFPNQATLDKEAGVTVTPYEGPAIVAFALSIISFTPTNLVFIALLAGLVGGCASNAVAETMSDDQIQQLRRKQLMYLQEHPLSAVVRSFIVYLCVVAGLYFAMDDPFKNSTPGQYMHLAGTLSLFSFVVGYDPSRIEQWLRLIPNPRSMQGETDQAGHLSHNGAEDIRTRQH